MNEFVILTITAMVPFVFVAQGTMLSGRAGIFNVAQEGLMLLGAAVGTFVDEQAERRDGQHGAGVEGGGEKQSEGFHLRPPFRWWRWWRSGSA